MSHVREFHRNNRYEVGGHSLSSEEMIDRYAQMVDEFPIWSIEDGMGESDTSGWRALTERLGESIQLVGWMFVAVLASGMLRPADHQLGFGSA
nr:hypothetical protein [Mycobacterium mantenii]